MVLGMSVETFTFLHVVISLVGIMTGFVVVGLMLQSAPIRCNAFFLVSTILTSVSGYFFPIKGLTPAHIVGAISLITPRRGAVCDLRQEARRSVACRHVGTAIFALYLNVFVGVVQSFQKFAYLNRFAPTGSEPPFAGVQLLVLILFIIAGIAVARRYRPASSRERIETGIIGLVLLAALGAPAMAQTGTVERLYVMDCGHNAATDQARWSPGVNVGKPIELSDNCYLIKHGAQWLLWDTGYPDAVADKPLTSPIGTATRAKKLADQLAELGVKPADITYVAVSHTHGDHVGNVDMFPNSTAADPEGRARLGVRRGQAGAFQEGPADEAAERRLRRVRRRQRRHPVDAGPYAGAPVAARAPGQDRLLSC